ncbi:MAG: BTAD domain-containing putative transcriptional regulator [Chloroflexota bacterium]
MSEFRLRLFGGLQAVLGEEDLTRPLSVKAQGLLCYLAVTGRPHSRLSLTGLFWSEKPEEDALRSLRVELTKMRKVIPDYLDVTRQTLAFVGGGPYWVDVESFAHHMKLAQNADGAVARSHWREAVALYAGDFLAGYQAGDAFEFEEWVLAQRERYRTAALLALTRLVDFSIQQREFNTGIEFASQLLHIDPWREEAHRSLMWLYAHSGQRGAALRQFDMCQEILANELGVEPEPQTLDLWQQIKESEGSGESGTQILSLPEAKPVDAAPFQAPALAPFFTGRSEELAFLEEKVRECGQGPVLLCVSGMGGVGKSTLVTHLAHQVREDFPDGVLWADASANPDAIAERWTQAYGYDFSRIAGMAERMAAVRELLGKKQALIILDNVEVAARVKPLLPTEGRVAVIATTRNAEMAAALNAELVNLDVLTLENGRSLLTSIVGQERVQKEQTAVDQICQMLQSLPLALAIAGQYLVSRPRRRLADFADRLAAMPLLALDDSEGVVRASFDISWDALDQNQQRIFAMLAVFNGRSFTAEAMAHIAEQDNFVTQDQLDTLAARSLLTERGSQHYQQHALLAQFAQEKLTDRQPSTLRLIDYFSRYAETFRDNYRQLGLEWENLDAVVELTASLAQWPHLFHLTRVLHKAWFARGHFRKARQAYAYFYEGAKALQDKVCMAEGLFNQGQAALEMAQFEETKELFYQALDIYEQSGLQNQAADVQLELARIYIDQANLPQAEKLLTDGLAVKQVFQDELGIAKAKFRQARLAHRRAEFEQVLHLTAEAMAIQERLSDKEGLIRTLDSRTWAYIDLGQYDEAFACAQRKLALAEEIEDAGEIALASYLLADIYRLRRDYDKALHLAQESLDLLERMGDTRSQGLVLYRFCLIHRDQGNFEESIRYARKCLDIFEKLPDRLFVSYTIGTMGMAYFGLCDFEQAGNHWRLAAKMAKEANDTSWLVKMEDYLDRFKSIL